MTDLHTVVAELPSFDRHFWDGAFHFTRIGTGAMGGKATGLNFAKDLLAREIAASDFPGIEINVPTMAVIATDCFDEFIARNHLGELPVEEMPDDRIGLAFEQADLPVELLGDLRALITQVKTPLAIRSSSLLEDALNRPFAGVYATKMIPNNQFDPDSRFRRLVEAIKFVYASTFFREARDYIKTTGCDPSEEKMAVIIQEVVGLRHGDRFYPDVSGVARSYNFYPTGTARPEEGVASLALGLGKTIVDGGVSWTFSPAYPKNPPPFGSVQELLRGTQTDFWAINMGKAPAYDPVSETEYMVLGSLKEAETDDVLRHLASTFDPVRDRVIPGTGARGARILDFAPLLVLEQFPINRLIQALLKAAETALGANVEIEFALTIQDSRGQPPQARLGFLQVRPMVVSEEVVDVSVADLSDPGNHPGVGFGDGQRDRRGHSRHRLCTTGELLSHADAVDRAAPGANQPETLGPASAISADRIWALGQLSSFARYTGSLEPDIGSPSDCRSHVARNECRAESGLALLS